MITCAKGLTSGYSPLGAMIASDRLFEPFYDSDTMFPHGYTFGGHPVSTAVALANLDIFEREGLNDRVRQHSPALRATLEKLYDLPIVGDVRGEGYFFGIELVKDQATRQTFTDEERRALLGRVSSGLFEAGLYCRTDDRGDSVIQLAPPLISGQAEFDTIESIVRGVLGPGAALGSWHGANHVSTRSGGSRHRSTRCRTCQHRALPSSRSQETGPRMSSLTRPDSCGRVWRTGASCGFQPTAASPPSSPTPAGDPSVCTSLATAGS